MNGVSRTLLGIFAGATAIFMLEPRVRPRRVVSAVRRVRPVLGSRGVVDRSLAAEVASRLDDLTPRAPAIQVSAEHGCVLLTGDVLTNERARLVRDVAAVPGVDSVVDLLTERPSTDIGRRNATPAAPARAPNSALPRRYAGLETAAGIAFAIVALVLALAPTARRLRLHASEVNER
jgi:hypothetical protein